MIKIIPSLEHEIYTNHNLHGLYRKVYNSFTKDEIFPKSEKEIPSLEHDVYVVKDVPEYLELKTVKFPKNYGFKKIRQYKGHMINFNGIKDLKQYLNEQFGKSSRYKLRRGKERLETSFDITYSMHYGNISEEEFGIVWEYLYKLLAIRSIEKGILNNRHLSTKEKYREKVYEMIHKKSASLYVIYDGTTPIDICLNFHLRNTIYQYIRTYDINYSKFNTGYINLMKQIEWCIDNEVRFIAFSRGDYYWKQRWCNYEYLFDFHIIYNKKSIKSIFEANTYYIKRWLYMRLKEKNLIEKYHKLKNIIFRKKLPNVLADYEIVPYSPEMDMRDMEEIDIRQEKNKFVRKAVYDLLFETKDKASELHLYQFKDEADLYLVQGKNQKAIVKLNDNSEF